MGVTGLWAKLKGLGSKLISGSGTVSDFYSLTNGQYVYVTVAHTSANSADAPVFGAMTGGIVQQDLARTTASAFCVKIVRDTSLDTGYESGDLDYTWTRRVRQL